MENIYHEYEYLIRETISRCFNSNEFKMYHGISEEDLYQYGSIGLHNACVTYDETKETKFKTHAINHIKWSIYNESKRDTLGCDRKYIFELLDKVSLDASITVSDSESSNLYNSIHCIDSDYEDYEVELLWEQYKKNIPEHTAKYIEDIMKGYTISDLFIKYDVSRQAIMKSIKNVRRKLKDLYIQH